MYSFNVSIDNFFENLPRLNNQPFWPFLKKNHSPFFFHTNFLFCHLVTTFLFPHPISLFLSSSLYGDNLSMCWLTLILVLTAIQRRVYILIERPNLLAKNTQSLIKSIQATVEDFSSLPLGLLNV